MLVKPSPRPRVATGGSVAGAAVLDSCSVAASLYELITRYGQALVGSVMQAAACNAVHSVEQRLSRWLLLAHDRIGSDDFPLTQEFAAMMLGTSRPTVTVVAGTLQKAGLIKYHRGHVTITNRENLEAASCECYQTATDLLGTVARGRSEAVHGRLRTRHDNRESTACP